MKVEQTKSFTPVVITLESQEEVDALFAVLNYTPISDAIKSAFKSEYMYTFLDRYNTLGYSKYFLELEDRLRKA